MSHINSGFNNFQVSGDKNIFPDENLKSFFTKCNSIETPFDDFDHPVSIDSKYHDINDFNKLKINENLSLATLYLNTASLSKHFENLQNFLFLLKHSSKYYWNFRKQNKQRLEKLCFLWFRCIYGISILV